MSRRDPRRRTLVIEQGRTLRQPFRIRNKDTGTVIDPVTEGFTSGVLQVRDEYVSAGGEVLLVLTTDNGGIVLGKYTDDYAGEVSGYIYRPATGATGTDQLTPWGEAVYDMVLTHTDETTVTVAYGPAVLFPAASEVS